MKLTKHEKSVMEKLLHEACVLRDEGKCRKCGKSNTLCASHIYPKGKYKRMRYLLDNVISLCYYCHIHWWHKNPIEAKEWADENIDTVIMCKLKLATQTIDKKPIDYKMLRVGLENEIKKYKK